MLDGDTPSLPPLLRADDASENPFARAVSRALTGADPGLVTWARRHDRLEAAIVLAPEQPLENAVAVLLVGAVAIGDAIGALAPPEVAVHYDWPGELRVNGALCGRMRIAAANSAATEAPDWMVLGLELDFLPSEGREGGETPDRTFLYAEGCGEMHPLPLLESWSRHLLVWINRFLDDGLAPVHAAWRARAWKMGEALADGSGLFVGLDELGGMLVKNGDRTILRELTEALEE